MKESTLVSIVRFCERTLQTTQFTDWPGAVNGLQVENDGAVTKIAAAVDASSATIRKAIASDANLLIVHHGLFWGPTHPWTGKRFEMINLLLKNNLAVYSSHLPLDAHPKIGNNILLGCALGFREFKPFFFEKGRAIGLQTTSKIQRTELMQRLTRAVANEPKLLPGGPEACRKIGIVTGGAGDELKKAYEEGVDTFITGEGRHWTFALAEELGINVLYAGHYATETFGVKALAKLIAQKFHVPWLFIDHPTGL